MHETTGRVRALARGLAIALLAVAGAHAEIVAESGGAFRQAETTTQSIEVELSDTQREYGVSVTAILDTGSGSLRVIGPSGNAVYQHLWSTRDSHERARLPVQQPGTYTIETAVDNARGVWRARIVALPPRAALRWMYLSAALLVVCAIAGVAVAHRRGAPFRYAAAGAVMLVAGKAVWFAGAIVLELTVRYAFEDALPYVAFLWMQSIVLGLWQGIAATLAVAAVATAVKSLRERPSHALAAGIGTGASEMFMTGVLSFLGLAIMFGDGPKSGAAQFHQAYDMAVTPLLPLAEPATLALQTTVTAAATLLVVFALRERRIGAAFGGAALFAVALAAAGASRTVALFGPESRWVIAAMLLPAAALSFVVIRRNVPAWTGVPLDGETPLDAFEREHGETLH